MLGTLQFIEKSIIDRLFSAPAPLSNPEKAAQFLCMLSLALVVVGFAFLIYGAHAWLSLEYRSDIAALMTGIMSLGLSALTAIILFLANYYHNTQIKKYQRKITDKIKLSLSTLEDEFGTPVRENPKTAVTIAALLGFLFEDHLFEQHKKI